MIGTIFFPLSRVITAIAVFFSTLFGGGGLAAAFSTPAPGLGALPYPAWVHEHMVWEHHGTQASAIAFVKGFTDRDIPVGIVDIEPHWATALTTYEPDKKLYPDMKGMIDHFHGQGTKVLLWTSCMLNEDAESFQEAKEKGYLVSNGKLQKWWNGVGAFIDFSNPEAVDWWHRQMDIVLDMGADGWKVDGAEPYIVLQIPSWGKGGPLSWSRYKKLMYDDFYYYTKEKTNGRGVAWARPTDDTLGWGLPITFMDSRINFMGWVGDQDNDWKGLRGALNQMFTSSLFNYVCYGSDIGGFRSGPADDPKDVFIRWAQLGALCPVMENGGGGEHRPWMYDEETTSIYRKFVKLHYRLIPYIQSQVAYAHELRRPTMRPTAGYYQYMLGDDIFVAPIVSEGNDRTILFPAGEWIYLFDETKTYKQGVKKLSFPLDEFPVFIRRGAILPMGPESLNNTGEFTAAHVYPERGTNSFGLYEDGKPGTTLSYRQTGDTLTLNSTATDRPLLFRVYGAAEPTTVKLGDTPLAKVSSLALLKTLPSGYCVEDGALWVAAKNAAAGVEIVIQ